MKKIAMTIANKLKNYKVDRILEDFDEYRDLRNILVKARKNANIEDHSVKNHDDEQYEIYVAAYNLLAFIIEVIGPELRPFDQHTKIAEDASEKYMPSWPTMSPVSRSFFYTWLSLDLRIGADKESYTSCIIEVSKYLSIDTEICRLFTLMSESRLGIYKVLDNYSINNMTDNELLKNRIIIEEIFTKKQYVCFCGNQKELKSGMLCLIRLFPPIDETFDHYVAICSPYILISEEKLWHEFFDRAIKGSKEREGLRTGETEANYAEFYYEEFMKNGLGPLYWLEYVFQSYAGYTALVIFLKGVPDIGVSRPVFFKNDILPEREIS